MVSLAVPAGPAVPSRLAKILRQPELRSAVWDLKFRADCWPESMVPPLIEAAAHMGFVVDVIAKQVSFARPDGLAQVKTSPRYVAATIQIPVRSEHGLSFFK